MFYIGLKQCKKCGFKHGNGHCCIDIYQRIGHQKGKSITYPVLLAFILPVLVFIGSLIVVDYILSIFMSSGGLRTLFAFIAAVGITLVFVQLVRIFTRKPIDQNMLKKLVDSNNFQKDGK